MKKFIILSFVFVMLLAMSAMASETRVMTMGDNNNILLDDANIWLYPSRLLNHTNIAVAEIDYSDSDIDILGINWKLDDNSALGTYFTEDVSGQRINLFYGRDMNGNKFGIHADLNHWSNKNEGANLSENGANFYNFTFGLTEANGQWDVAVNFGTGSFTNIDVAGADISESDGMSQFGIKGRYFQVKNPNYTMIYHVELMSSKDDTTFNATSITNAHKTTMIDLGCGLNFTPSSHVLAVFDFGIMNGKTTFEETGETDIDNKRFTLPYFKLGMDGEVFKWLDVRFGATSYWNNDKREEGADSFTMKYAENTTYFGLGFNFNHLHVDFEANPEFFTDGPDFLSGASENLTASGGTVSVTYDF